jgi:glycosyltransferase involved in cell wall biosynthesis
LARRGHGNWIACRPGAPLAWEADRAGVPVLPLSPWAEWDPLAARRLRRFLKAQAAQVLHAHTGHAVGLGALAVRGTAVRFVATRRVDFPLKTNLLSRAKAGRVDAWAAISGRVGEMLSKAGIPPEKTTVIPSGVCADGYPALGERDRLRREKGYSKDDVLIVTAGALVPHKDHATFLKAAARVAREEPRAKFLVLGEGPLRGELEGLAREAGINDRVFFLGHRPEVLEYTAMADLFVFSSAEEGLGTALLDALAIGVPTAATRAGGIPDLYGGPAAPELSPPRDPEALARNILCSLQDPEEARRRVARGLERAARFTVSAMADGYEKFYASLLMTCRN